MSKTSERTIARRRRHTRVRRTIRGTADRPRLAVFKSARHIYAQLIDDRRGLTIASASTLDSQVRESIGYGGNIEAAKRIGALIAERAIAQGIKRIVFDRGGFIYHGRVKAVADAAREAGLEF
ncbi:MAG: 50S ribosomal protein L18 [Actinobacteria bacterium]|nr:50S ribosomal protein L18 [Actinomycetota bacterium]